MKQFLKFIFPLDYDSTWLVTTRYHSQLLTGPIIPVSVTTMSSTFYGCTNLSGTLQINSSIISDMSSCFQNVKSLAVKVPASSTTYDTITSAYGSSTNITIETFEPET